MSLLAAAVERDRRKRTELAERKAKVPMVLVRNRCVEVLSDLPDPRQALEVVEGIRRSIIEFLAVKARQ